ncbi:MAG: hypothetical protein ACRDZU_15720 [Acidimicrobiales bacterium]
MANDEAAWLHLYEQARSAFDDAAANQLMNALERHPATKDDIVRLDARIDVLEANLRGEITSASSDLLRTLFFGMVASNATLVGLVFAAVRLA